MVPCRRDIQKTWACYSGAGAKIDWIERVLAVGQQARKSDGIFVLAGARARKVYVLELYREGYAPLILVSVGRFEIRRFADLSLPYPPDVAPIDLLAAAQVIAPAERHFFVEFDGPAVRFEKIERGRLGTLREIRALAAWCKERPEISSLMIVSSGYHLRRVRMCCRVLLPKAVRVNYVAAPADNVQRGEGLVEGDRSSLLLELLKLPAYSAVLLWIRAARIFD